MLNIVLCDDNLIILEKLSKMIESIILQYSYEAKITFKCSNGDDLMEHINNNSVDVLVLDINLKSDVSGIALAKEIRKTNKDLYLIFTTGHLEYSLIAYQLKTFDYIPKPITRERLEDTFVRLFDDIENNKTIFLKIGSSKVIVKSDDILYIIRDGMKLVYHSIDKDYIAYSSFKKIYDSLPDSFARSHKSYLVNMKNIKSTDYNKNIITFINNDECYIGPKYKNSFLEELNRYGIYTNDNTITNHSE